MFNNYARLDFMPKFFAAFQCCNKKYSVQLKNVTWKLTNSVSQKRFLFLSIFFMELSTA